MIRFRCFSTISMLMIFLTMVICSEGGAQEPSVSDHLDHSVTNPPQSALPDLSLMDKESRINSSFGSSLDLMDPLTADPSKSYRIPGRFIVHFKNDLTLKKINENRSLLSQSKTNTLQGIPPASLDMALVIPTLIDTSFSSAPPHISLTQPAPRMARNKEYIPITRFLSKEYGITISSELYYGAANWAVFKCDSSTDVQALAHQIQRENNDFVYIIEPDSVMFPADYFPRPMDELLDCITPIGTGIDDPTNGRVYWNYNDESYHYFQSGIYRVHASAVGYGLDVNFETGEGYVTPGLWANVYVADSGVDSGHPDLFGALKMPPDPLGINDAYWDTSGDGFTNFMDYLVPPDPHAFHGTKCCGIVGARQRNGGVVGMIPNGTVFPFKIMGSSMPPGYPYGSISTVALAMQRAFDSRLLTESYTFSLSWGARQAVRPLIFDTVLENISTDSRFIIVAAAHNHNEPVRDNTDGMWPAAMAGDSLHPDHVISVMAINIDDDRSSFSNYEDPAWPGTVTISASGGDVIGLTSYGSLTTGGNGSYTKYNGTSMSTPIVAGFIGLLQSYKEMSAAEVKAHIVSTARSLKWDGSPIGPLTKPILDCDTAMSWGNLKMETASGSIASDPPVITYPTVFNLSFFPAGGMVQDNSATLTAELIQCVTDPGCSASIGIAPLVGPDLNGMYTASFTFNPNEWPETHGNTLFWAQISVDPGGGAEIRQLNTWPVRAKVLHEWELWEKQSISPMWDPWDIALGHDAQNKIYVGFSDLDQTTGDVRDVSLAIEGTAGDRNFTTYVVDDLDDLAPYITTPIDMSIGTANIIGNNYTGVLYQRYGRYTSPYGTERATFGFVDSGLGDYLVDINSEPYLRGRPESSLKGNLFQPNWYCLRYDFSTDHFFLGTRNFYSQWSDSDLGDSVIPEADITRVDLTSYQNAYGGIPRAAMSRIYNMYPPVTYSVTYGIPNHPSGMLEMYVPKTDIMATGDRWVGTALLGMEEGVYGGPWGQDADYRPVVFLRSWNTDTNPTGYLDAAVGNDLGGFTAYPVELCESGPQHPGNYPYRMGYAGEAVVVTTPERHQVAIVYISGNQTQLDSLDTSDLKIAYHDYDGDWSTPWKVMTVDPFPGIRLVKVDVVENKIVILYVKQIPNGTGGVDSVLTLAFEPEFAP